jgi:hypothetical protein
MDERVLKWLKANEGETFESPRSEISKRRKYDLKIVRVGFGRVDIEFVGSKYQAMPLYFWMFERALDYVRENRDRPIRLGAKLQSPYEPDTIEEQIWKSKEGICPYKAAPHICDILAIARLVEYILVDNPDTHRKVQAIKLVDSELYAL